MKRAIACSLLLLMTGCSMIPAYDRPTVKAASEWSQPSAESQINADWWRNFQSAELDALMQTALAENNDLRAALQRIEQSRAALKIAGASLLPQIGATAGASSIHTSPASGPNTSRDQFSAGLSLSYEVDLFGRNRAGIAAAEANLQGSAFDSDALKLVVMGDVANGYFTLLGLRQRLQVAERNLDIARDILRLVEAQLDAGRSSMLEVAQQRANLASAEASRAALQQQMETAENALAVLLGQPPRTVAVENTTLDGLQVPAIAPGQPSTLVERRPDIAASEASLRAANATIGVARAAFFPTLNLGLDGSAAVAALGNPATTALSLAAGLAAPIFQGGRLEGGVEQMTAIQSERVETYRKTVLTAFREVEDALSAVRASSSREESFAAAMREARTSYDLSRQLFEAGSANFQTLLDAQRVMLSSEDGYVQARRERLAAAVDLYKALGGGWR